MDYAQELQDYREGKRGLFNYAECNALVEDRARLMATVEELTATLASHKKAPGRNYTAEADLMRMNADAQEVVGFMVGVRA